MAVRSYRDLIVWQKAMGLVVESYRLAGTFPTDERYGLTSQFRRAAVSIPANIAEGHGRLHRGDYVHHLSIATGSLMELETCAELACRLQYVDADAVSSLRELMDHVGRMLTRLTRRLYDRPSIGVSIRTSRAPSPESRVPM